MPGENSFTYVSAAFHGLIGWGKHLSSFRASPVIWLHLKGRREKRYEQLKKQALNHKMYTEIEQLIVDN